jgi:hypothetical protein
MRPQVQIDEREEDWTLDFACTENDSSPTRVLHWYYCTPHGPCLDKYSVCTVNVNYSFWSAFFQQYLPSIVSCAEDVGVITSRLSACYRRNITKFVKFTSKEHYHGSMVDGLASTILTYGDKSTLSITILSTYMAHSRPMVRSFLPTRRLQNYSTYFQIHPFLLQHSAHKTFTTPDPTICHKYNEERVPLTGNGVI